MSLLFKRDGKMWLLKSHDVDMRRVFGPMTSHLVVETPLGSNRIDPGPARSQRG